MLDFDHSYFQNLFSMNDKKIKKQCNSKVNTSSLICGNPSLILIINSLHSHHLQLIFKIQTQIMMSQEFNQLPHNSISKVEPECTPFKQFSYNDSEAYKGSTDQLWTDVYQYPSDTSFFKRKKQSGMKDRGSQQKTLPSAKDAWSMYDPEKEQMNLFQMFKEGKRDGKSNEEIKEKKLQPSAKVKRGWGELFSQPFWGTTSQKPPPFMGAFDHVQPDFGASLNISIPSNSIYNPYSQYIQPSSIQISNPYQSQSKILDSLDDCKQKNKYYFQVESVQSEQQPLGMDDLKESKIEHKQESIDLDRSVAWSFEVLFGDRGQFKCTDPAWQTLQDKPVDNCSNSRVFEIHKESNQQVLQSLESQVSLPSDIIGVLPDSFIISQISKILQNVECQLFVLNYDTLTWGLELLSFRPQWLLRDSLKEVLNFILDLASKRSRVGAAVLFLRQNKSRKIYNQLGTQVSQFLIMFEQIILELTSSTTLLQFFHHCDSLSCQINLLYDLLINSEYIQQEGKTYDCFDFRFLHSQLLIFKRILKLSRNGDTVELQTAPLVMKLLTTAFRPLLGMLDKILFEECEYLELNTDLYMRYYFPNPKQILDSVGRKLYLIKEESNQLYLICKVKEELQLVQQIGELEHYSTRWDKVFKKKRKLVEKLRRRHKRQIRHQKQRRREQKMREYFQLQSKIYEQEKKESQMRQEQKKKKQNQLRKLKIQLEQRQEKRELLQELQKAKQRNMLLDIELGEKQRLAREKEKLMKELEEARMVTVLKEDYQVDGKIEEKMEVEEIILPSELEVESQIKMQAEEDLREQLGKNNDKPQQSQFSIESHEAKNRQIESAPLQIQSNIDQQEHQVASENVIPSRSSIQSLERRYIQTADAFGVNRNRLDNNSRTGSYIRMVNKPADQYSLILPHNQEYQSGSEDNQSSVDQQMSGQIPLNHNKVNLQTCLSICVDQIVKKQSEVVQDCLRFIILDKYEILTIIQFMRQTFMSGNGQKLQQFIHLSIGPGSMLSLRHFNKCLLFDSYGQNVQKLYPSFYHSKANFLHGQINIFQDNLEHYIGFQFQHLPPILQSFFSYIHLSKYMQILSFIMRLRHCDDLVTQSWKLLNGFKRDIEKRRVKRENVRRQTEFMGILCRVRHRISNFIKTFSNYFFWRVIQKEYKIIRPKLTQLDQLSQNHLKMLDNIILYGLIDNPTHNISSSFRKILSFVQEFFNIVLKLTSDDIPGYSWDETQERAQYIGRVFAKELKDIEVLLFRPT